MPFSVWRFCNTCMNKNEKTAHTCRYICELSLILNNKVHVYTQQEEQPSNLFLHTVNFADSHTELSLKLSSMYATLFHQRIIANF